MIWTRAEDRASLSLSYTQAEAILRQAGLSLDQARPPA